MRTLTRPRRHYGHDPAPSRTAYRLTRFWLSPWLRWTVTTVLPVCALTGAAGFWLMQPAQQQRIVAGATQIRDSVEARPEFQIRQMAITGASPVLAETIRQRIGLDFPVSWFHLDTHDIHDTVAALDAVADARVTVELGGALHIDVREREPVVLWRHDGALEMLDATGHRIAYIDRRDGLSFLPLVTGDGADAAIPEALALFEAAKPIMKRVRALTRQGARRWDVVLDRGQIIQLPETDPRAALERVLAMQDSTGLLTRDVAIVDIRDPARLTVRLGPAAAENLETTRSFGKGIVSQ